MVGAARLRLDSAGMRSREGVYIAGVAETALGKVLDQTENSMVALAADEALAEAGMTLKDVDGLFVNYMGEEGSVQVGEYLGLQPRYADSSDMGGGSFEAFVHKAMVAIEAGHCDVALIAYASRQRSRRNRSMAVAIDDSIAGQFEAPFGLPLAIGHYALIASRHMHEFGTTPEQLAEVAVTAREWAQMNPKAWSRDPLTVDDVLASSPISEPFHKLDCCLRTDGGGAIVVTGEARAKDAAKRPIRVLGAAESHTHWHISQMHDLTTTCARESGREAFERAGITPGDVDVFEPYDNFTSSVILELEDLGFCPKGEGGAFVADGHLKPGGSLPSMTMGGGLSYCHPGALGILLLVEAVRQLRGEAGERQVPDAEIAVAHGIGGISNSAGATVVLARD
jgi:acetyl-CoA acetyltransferase